MKDSLDALIEEFLNQIQERLQDVEFAWFQTIGKTLKKLYGTDNLSVYSQEYMETIAADLRKLRSMLGTANTENLKTIENMFNQITAEVYDQSEKLAELKGQGLSPKAVYRAAITPQVRKTMRNYSVMAKSTTTDKLYKNTMRKMVNRMTLYPAAPNFHQTMRAAVTILTEQGISIVHYDNKRNPYNRRLDSSVRVALSGEMNQIVQDIQHKLAAEIGADGFEVSAHEHCSPGHESVQGKTFTADQFELLQEGLNATDTDGETHNLGNRVLGQYNCLHLYFPVLIGISEPSHTREELEAIKQRNHDGIEWNGKHESLYDMTQKMRQNETEQRRQRGALEITRQVAENDPAFRQDIKEMRASIKALDTDYKAMGTALESYNIIMKPGRKYNINARAFR